MMADPEKTMLDCLDRPVYAGGVPEVTAMMSRGRHRLDWTVVCDYALRFRTQSLVQRLGYLAELVDVQWSEAEKRRLASSVGKSYAYLGQTAHWGTGGEYAPEWQLVVNIPRQELMAEIEVL
jgi:predicted transcriptional regulator of viral defense system